MAAKCGARVTLTDREDCLPSLEQLKATISLNDIDIDTVDVVGLTWGLFSPQLYDIEPQDYIIASDCFYDSKGLCFLDNNYFIV